MGSNQKSTSNPGPPRKQNYDQGSSPQAELRPWRFPTSRITTREPTHKQNYDQGAGWLAGSGWLAEAEIGGVGMEQACHASGWKTYIRCIFRTTQHLHTYTCTKAQRSMGLSKLHRLQCTRPLHTYICKCVDGGSEAHFLETA